MERGVLRTGGLCIWVYTGLGQRWQRCVFVYTCGLVGGGSLIVMHVDGFRDTSFQKQGPH